MTHRINKHYFQGSGKIWDRQGGLAALIRGLAVDNAILAIAALTPAAYTDNSGGTAGSSLLPIPVEFDVFDATAGGGVQASGFNTALGTVRNAHAVLATYLGNIRARLGLPAIAYAEGTIATPGTIPAVTATATAGTGTASVTRASFIAAAKVIAYNQGILAKGMSEIFAAIGEDFNMGGLNYDASRAYQFLAIPPVVANATAGAPSVTTANGTALLVATRNNIATFAELFDDIFIDKFSDVDALPLSVVAADV